jgi:hypothetical protein
LSHAFLHLSVIVLSSLLNLNAVATEPDSDEIASTFAKAANYAYLDDFVHSPVSTAFSSEELLILATNLKALKQIVRAALGHKNSVGGALLSAHFDIRENFDLLRWHMLEPGRTYGWEGTYESDKDRYYSDEQYVYHSVYLTAIEDLMEAPLRDVITLSAIEREKILTLAHSPGHESYHWANWIGRKLGLF